MRFQKRLGILQRLPAFGIAPVGIRLVRARPHAAQISQHSRNVVIGELLFSLKFQTGGMIRCANVKRAALEQRLLGAHVRRLPHMNVAVPGNLEELRVVAFHLGRKRRHGIRRQVPVLVIARQNLPRTIVERAVHLRKNAPAVIGQVPIRDHGSLAGEHLASLRAEELRDEIGRAVAAEDRMKQIVEVRAAGKIHTDAAFELMVRHNAAPFKGRPSLLTAARTRAANCSSEYYTTRKRRATNEMRRGGKRNPGFTRSARQQSYRTQDLWS